MPGERSGLKIRRKDFSYRLSSGLINRWVLQVLFQYWRAVWDVYQLQENRAERLAALYLIPKHIVERNHLEPVWIWNKIRLNVLPKMHTEEFGLDFSLKFQLWICIFENIQPVFSLKTEKQEHLIWILTCWTRTTKKEDKKNSRREWLIGKNMAENNISSKCFGEKWTYAIGNKFISCCRVFASFKVGFFSSTVLHIQNLVWIFNN